jgi:hypothetical protein
MAHPDTHLIANRSTTGDTIITGALCAGLQAVGDELVKQKRFTQKAATLALTSSRELRKIFVTAATSWLGQFTFDGPTPELSIAQIEPKYRGEDLGVHFTWQVGAEQISGVYPVNLKNEKDHGVGSSGKCRIGKRYGTIKRITGRNCTMHVNGPEQIAEIITGGEGAALGVGILAFAKNGKDRCAIAYDVLYVYALSGGIDAGDKTAKGPLRTVMQAVADHCVEESLDPVGTYDNEGFLIQAQHHHAGQVWGHIAPQLVLNGIYASSLLGWFAARFDGKCVELTKKRLVSLERDYHTGLSYL